VEDTERTHVGILRSVSGITLREKTRSEKRCKSLQKENFVGDFKQYQMRSLKPMERMSLKRLWQTYFYVSHRSTKENGGTISWCTFVHVARGKVQWHALMNTIMNLVISCVNDGRKLWARTAQRHPRHSLNHGLRGQSTERTLEEVTCRASSEMSR
jgi:hypothetical protein